MNKSNLKNLILKDYVTKKEIKETLNKLYNEGFIIIHNKSAIPVHIECEGYKILSILEGNGLDQDLLDLYREGEAEKVEFTICTIAYESGETQYGSGHGNVYHIPSGYWLEDKIEGRMKEIILTALQL